MNRPATSDFLKTYGPCALVTGASSGIGREIAVELARLGFDLVMVARDRRALTEFANELIREHGSGRIYDVVAADLATVEGIESVTTAVAGKNIGLLVAAAGFGTAGNFVESDLADETAMLEVNCRAPMVLARHFGKRLVDRRTGGIIFFGSLVGYQGAPRAAHYAATKAYIQTFAEGLHHELKSFGDAVLSCAPGPVRTGLAARARMTMGGADTPSQVARGTLKALGRRMTVTPGPMSKFLTTSLMMAPRRLRVRIMGMIMKGMTREI